MTNDRRATAGNCIPYLCFLLLLLVGCDETNSDWSSVGKTEKGIGVNIAEDVLSEGGAPITISFVLTAEPEHFVDIKIQNPDGQMEIDLEAPLRIMPIDWRDTLRIDVSARLDHVIEDSPHSGLLNIISESTDSDYNLDLTGNDPLIFNILDGDVAGLGILTDPLVVEEMAEELTPLFLSLLCQPLADVAVSVRLVSPDSYVSFVPESPTLIFTPENWNIPQAVYVQIAGDDIYGNHRTNGLAFSLESVDENYHSLAIETAELIIIDTSPLPQITFNQQLLSSLTEGNFVTFDFMMEMQGSCVDDVLFSIMAASNASSPQPGSDFVALPDTLVFEPGQNEMTVSMEIINDDEVENAEMGVFSILALDNCVVGGGTIQIRVVFMDDD